MNKNSKHIANEARIVRFLGGDFTEREKEDLEIWMNEDPENRKSFEEMKKIWDHSVNIKDFQSNDTNDDWLKVKKRINFERSRYIGPASVKENLIRSMRAAAVFILLLGIGFLAKQYIFRPPDMILISTRDFKDEILLPDGSRVVLNKYSELKYPKKFQGNRRQVDLKGEGYFDVTQNPDKLFRIKINTHAIVEVLGTSFNLKSDSTDGSVNLHVISGRVAFFTPETEDNRTILIKDEQAALQNGIISKYNLNDKNFLSWKTGILYFDNEKIENVFNELTKYYSKVFVIKNLENRDVRLTSKFDNQELVSVLEEIKLVLNLDYTLNRDTITYYNPL